MTIMTIFRIYLVFSLIATPAMRKPCIKIAHKRISDPYIKIIVIIVTIVINPVIAIL